MLVIDFVVKNELFCYFVLVYIFFNFFCFEEVIGNIFEFFFDWFDKFSFFKKFIDFDKFFIFVILDVIGEVIFFKQFGFLREGKDINNIIVNIYF